MRWPNVGVCGAPFLLGGLSCLSVACFVLQHVPASMQDRRCAVPCWCGSQHVCSCCLLCCGTRTMLCVVLVERGIDPRVCGGRPCCLGLFVKILGTLPLLASVVCVCGMDAPLLPCCAPAPAVCSQAEQGCTVAALVLLVWRLTLSYHFHACGLNSCSGLAAWHCLHTHAIAWVCVSNTPWWCWL